ncbi:FimV/HubP family polar landmark protein [Ramlibacter sp. Leaf400]|uniref:FimV/HubP family polar landmark protein n=1 Tax=Ramlibacter sp. Leaf400 TaxID=1736365 RepID=UPI002E163708
MSLPSTPAQALALGRVTVQSALGEPLRVEIDVPEITADEVASLKASVASPDAFRAAGMEFSPALSGVNVSLQRRPDGRYYLRLASDRPVNEPFVDLILETNWASGRIVRDFTMLFDPPGMRQGQTPMTAQVTPSNSPARSGSAVPTPAAPQRSTRPAAPAAAAQPAAPATAAPAPAASSGTSTPAAAAPAVSGDGKQVTVQSGETAGRIAAANKSNTVSLDQMLLALLRANPDAFVGGNVNRLRAGSVLSLPTAEQAEAIPAAEARQTLVVQSRDFNEFRRRLAEGLPTAPTAGTGREATGRVQAQLDEKRPAAAAPDKLTLSKGGVQGRANADQVAQNRASQDAANRVAELNRNLSDLNKLTGSVPAGAAIAPKAGASAPTPSVAAAPAKPASGPALPSITMPSATTAAAPAATAAASAPVATAPLAAASTPAAAAAPASAPVAAITPTAPASAPAAAAPSSPASAPTTDTPVATPVTAAASAPAAATAPKRPVTPPPAIEEPSLVDELLANPLVPAAFGGALALLLGIGAWRMRQRHKSAQIDSSFLESRLQPDSFFGASGGQRVDTAEGTPTGSSMVYSPSQLDAAGDVDPVAEADVYLAYGRDLQAEEILKEALRINPQRIAIHSKLLEIYAKRRDAKAFEQLAGEAFSLTRGEGPEWAHICELGLELDATNPMYQPGGQPSGGGAVAATATAAAAVGASAAMAATRKAPEAAAPDTGASAMDLDLDFSLDDTPSAPSTSAPGATLGPDSFAAVPSLDMDFASAPTPAAPDAVRLDAPTLSVPDNSLSFTRTEPVGLSPAAPTSAPAKPAPAPADSGMIEFDLGSLSLDLPGASPAPAAATPASTDAGDSMSTAGLELDLGGDGEDPLATKLALAQEFNAIGDADGARSLAQEVIAEASGDLKSKAQKFLAEIG